MLQDITLNFSPIAIDRLSEQNLGEKRGFAKRIDYDILKSREEVAIHLYADKNDTNQT